MCGVFRKSVKTKHGWLSSFLLYSLLGFTHYSGDAKCHVLCETAAQMKQLGEFWLLGIFKQSRGLWSVLTNIQPCASAQVISVLFGREL